GLQPQAEAHEDQRIRGVEGVANDTVRSRVCDNVRALALQANDRDRERVGAKRETLDAPAECEEDETSSSDRRPWPRQCVPAKCVQTRDEGKPQEAGRKHAEEKQSVSLELLGVNWQAGALAQEIGMHLVHRERADGSNGNQYCQENPCPPPCDRS